MLITIHNIVFIYLFVYIFWGGGLYWCISVTYKLCMESHCVLAAFLKHAGMTISDALNLEDHMQITCFVRLLNEVNLVCAVHLASVLGSTKTERKCRLRNVRSYCCGHKVCSCAHVPILMTHVNSSLILKHSRFRHTQTHRGAGRPVAHTH